MADKNRTPDILGSVLSPPGSSKSLAQPEAGPNSQPTKQQGTKTAKQNTGITVRQHTDTAIEEPNEIPEAEHDKVKATFYLSSSTVEALEDAWLILRRQARSAGRKGAISKSAIVDMALKLTLEDLEVKGGDSQITGKLVDQ